MEQATIIGVVVATTHHPSLDHVRLLIARPEGVDGKPTGEPYVVADPLQAGVGQKVWVVHGREGALAMPQSFAPIDAAVVAIVSGCDSVKP